MKNVATATYQQHCSSHLQGECLELYAVRCWQPASRQPPINATEVQKSRPHNRYWLQKPAV